eukprot:CAMPEP_0181117912 /NCGR_PEP_ID=MMETSP1071-20121207/22789_1 /TAXON_ID=35127 /ORGANISM="Thalassiosira sp., Strain NH16" /LENGTH=216 /DNA_ID=CAMNT_0023202359 /DNA_START=146 /DNA_END=796 /DNA_ORIENTATION=-
MMGSQSKSSISIILCLVAIVAMATTIQAQLHTSPERYRSINLQQQQQQDTLGGKELGRQRQKRQRNSRNTERKTLESSMNLRAMSVPIMESEMSLSKIAPIDLSEMSLPIVDADFDLSLPMDLPTATHGDEIVALENGNSGEGSTLILASFLAGISALIIGAVALFVKMRRSNSHQVDETQQIDEGRETRVVPFDSNEEFNDEFADFEGVGHEIII